MLFHDRFVQAGRVDPSHRAGHAVRRIDDPGSLGFRQVSPHGKRPAAVLLDLVRTEHLERIFVIAMNHWGNRVEGELGLHDDILSIRSHSPSERSRSAWRGVIVCG